MQFVVIMKPSHRLTYLFLVLIVIGLLVAFELLPLWLHLLIMALVIGVSILDFALIAGFSKLSAERELPQKWALDSPGDVTLVFKHSGKRLCHFEILPHTAEHVLLEGMSIPWRGDIQPGHQLEIRFQYRMIERGEFLLAPVRLAIHSPIGLWRKFKLVCGESQVRVYPNFEPIVRHAILSVSSRQSMDAVNQMAKVGHSREFHQLREYQHGDMLEQVDWKATSRYRKLISREYREQRNQNVLIAIDRGRRMRALDGNLSQLDHCLNAALLVSYFALRQGDIVSVMGYGGDAESQMSGQGRTESLHGIRYLPPVKGESRMHVILNHLYDYQPTLQVGDYQPLAEQILSRQRRRALVLILSNFRTEDEIELLPAVKLLQTRHQVVIASLREQVVEDMLSETVSDLNSALDHAAARIYAEQRKTMAAGLISEGAHFLDETAQQFPLALTRHYMSVKHQGLM